jgi:methylenetetrahydrofolate reductase (NADPH)
LASTTMAANLAATIPDIGIPASLIRSIEADPNAGVDAACELVLQVRDSNAFEGVHLVPVSRFREVATRLEGLLT